MSWPALLDVSRESGAPLTLQVQERLRWEITGGALRPGTRLPPSRRLAADLGISRSVVVEAYEQLIAEGYLEAVQGSGTRVAAHLSAARTVPTLLDEGVVPAVRWDLRPGSAGPSQFPHREWLSCYQRILQSNNRYDVDYPSLSGAGELREQLAGYLGRVRGVHTAPEHVMVVSGFAQALGLLCAVLPDLGIREIGMEEPCHRRQRRFIQEAGLRPHPLPVDEHGLDVEALAASGLRAVLVTPAHQFPTGVTMTAQRREALARWAREVDGWVIEDDYDGDLWLEQGARPLALQRLAPERVVYGGTASKSLAPGLRLGWIAVPPLLRGPLERTRSRRDLGSDVFTQLAFAELLGSGLFDRHLRRQRARYRGRREQAEQAAQRFLPGARFVGAAAGVHAYLRLPEQTDEEALVEAALRRSVLVRGGHRFHARPGPTAPALVVGYAGLQGSGLVEALRQVGEAWAALPAGRAARRCA